MVHFWGQTPRLRGGTGKREKGEPSYDGDAGLGQDIIPLLPCPFRAA